MSRKPEKYVIGILFPTKTETTIKYVTSVEEKYAKWEDGKPAMTFAKDYAKDLAWGLCVNGHAAIPMLKADYLNLTNPDGSNT